MEFIQSTERTHNITVEKNTLHSYHTHMHSYFELILYESFDGTISVNDRDFTVDSFTCLLVAPSDFHRISVNGKTDAKYIKIGFEENVLSSPPTTSLILQGLNNNDFIITLFNELSERGHSKSYRKALINTAVCILSEQGSSILPIKTGSNLHLAAAAIKIINERFSEPISEIEVAQCLSVSPQYLSKIFKQTVGVGFSKHLQNTRIRRASKLLIETSDSITQICYACGFGALSHFLRCFKAEYGISPGNYRKQNTIR